MMVGEFHLHQLEFYFFSNRGDVDRLFEEASSIPNTKSVSLNAHCWNNSWPVLDFSLTPLQPTIWSCDRAQLKQFLTKLVVL